MRDSFRQGCSAPLGVLFGCSLGYGLRVLNVDRSLVNSALFRSFRKYRSLMLIENLPVPIPGHRLHQTSLTHPCDFYQRQNLRQNQRQNLRQNQDYLIRQKLCLRMLLVWSMVEVLRPDYRLLAVCYSCKCWLPPLSSSHSLRQR